MFKYMNSFEKTSLKNNADYNDTNKAELLQLKPHPFIWTRNKKFGNQKKLSSLLLYQF